MTAGFSSPPPGTRRSDRPIVAIAGAGLIGLFCARALARRGARVRLYDRGEPGRGASWAAAGMLAPAFEAAGDAGAHPHLFELCMAGLEAWDEALPELSGKRQRAIGHRPGPTLAVGMDTPSRDHLSCLEAGLARRGIAHERLDAAQLQSVEPALGASAETGLTLPRDGRVNNRAVLGALMDGLEGEGIELVAGTDPLTGLRREGAGWWLGDGTRADLLLEATGWRVPGLTPVKGVALALAPHAGLPDHVVRFGSGYIVAHQDRVVLGASVEPGRSDTVTDPRTVDGLLARAGRVCPAVARAQLLESWAGVRPATGDGGPAIGWRAPGHYVAAGHYRNGVLLAPLTGEIVARHMLDDARDALAAAFDPARFSPAPA